MNSPRPTPGADLAADLMADLTTVPTANDRAGSHTVVEPAAERTTARRLALQVVLRVEPLNWRLPSLRVNRTRVSMRIAAMYLEVGRPSF